MLPDDVQGKRRGIEVRLSMISSMTRLGYPEDSLEILQEGERLCQELGDEMSLSRLAGSIGLAYTLKGNAIQARRYNETAFQAAEGTDDVEIIAQTGFFLCTSYIVDGLYSEVVKVVPKVIARLESSQREEQIKSMTGSNVYSMLLAEYGSATGVKGDFEQGEALCEKGLRFALQLNDPGPISNVEVQTSQMFYYKGDSQKAVEHYKSCIKYCEETKTYIILGVAWAGLGAAYLQLGELETARSCVEKILKVYQDLGIPELFSHITYGFLGMVHIEEGDLETARNYIEKSLKGAQDRGSKFYEAWWIIWLARTYNWADVSESAQAEASLLQAIDIFSELEMKPHCAIAYSVLGELYTNIGQKEKALENLKKAEGMMQEMGMGYWLRRTQEVLEKVEV